MNKKVLFIDSWTKGIHNFLPIHFELKNFGWDSLLVHRGSWEHEKGRPANEVIDGLIVREFSYYNTRFIYDIIKKEQPNGVLILTTNYLFDRAVILAARALGVKSFFLMHGIRSVDEEAIQKQRNTYSKSLMENRWKNFNKYIFYLIPNYFYSGAINNWKFLFKKSSYSIIYQLFNEPHKNILFPPITSELHCDFALVWGNKYKLFFIEEYGYPKESVKVVGHPPLDPVFKLINAQEVIQKKKYISGEKINSPYCVYLESALVEQGALGHTDDYRIEHLDEISQLLKEINVTLVVKLHPLTRWRPIVNYFKGTNVKVIYRSIKLENLINGSEFVIGSGSTANDIAIVLNIPLILPGWGMMEQICVSTNIRQPSSILNNTKNDFSNTIKNINHQYAHKQKEREKYINEYITHTDGKAIERIVDNIKIFSKTN